MKILIFGAGILGRLLAAQMHNAQIDVTLLARNNTYNTIKEQGITLKNVLTENTIIANNISIIDTLYENADFDLIIVVMRKNQAIHILDILGSVKGTPPILFLGNNGTNTSDYSSVLPSSQIILGFLGAAGRKVGDTIEVTYNDETKIVFNSPHDHHQELIAVLNDLFQRAGFKTENPNIMDAWLKYNLALILPIAFGIMACDYDNYRLARTLDALHLIIQAVKELSSVLMALGYPVYPSKLKKLVKIPRFLLVLMFKKQFNSFFAEIAMAGHVRAAPDEMIHLYEEFKLLKQKTRISTPCMDYLYRYKDDFVPRIPDGQKTWSFLTKLGTS